MARSKKKADPHPDRKSLYVRVNDRANEALKDLLYAVRKTKILGQIPQEEFVAASWFWMATLDAADLARKLQPFMADVVSPDPKKLANPDELGASQEQWKQLEGPPVPAPKRKRKRNGSP